jgi:carotenoid 1,2-hydratase
MDAISDDGANAITIIAFIGSVFSPYYAAARWLGRGDPHNHCALNVALYNGRRKHWALTERPRGSLMRNSSDLVIGPSKLAWDGQALTISIEEWSAPIPSRIRGTVRVIPRFLTNERFVLDRAGRHSWSPIAPSARIEVEFDSPSLRWEGEGYLDSNRGSEPIEKAFTRWTWMRTHHGPNSLVLYDAEWRGGGGLQIATQIDPAGNRSEIPAPPFFALPSTGWLVGRSARSEVSPPKVVRTLEDTPFYARSLVETTLQGKRTVAMHESLSLDRVAHPVVRCMLPFRMPRRRSRTRQ